MGALTSNRKRGDDSYTLNSKFPSSYFPDSDRRVDAHISKKPKFPQSMQLSPDHPSRSSVSRFHRYPEPIQRFRREVHAPCRSPKLGFVKPSSSPREVLSRAPKLGFTASSKPSGSPREDISDMRSFLWLRYFKAKTKALGSLRYWKKDKEVIDINDDEETEKDDGLDDLSVEDVENVENVMELGGKVADWNLQPSSSSLVSDLTNENLKVESGTKKLDLLSLNRERDVSGVPLHKILLDSAERRNDRLSRLHFEIEFNEKRRVTHQLLRPVKKPEENVVREPFVPLTEEEEDEVARAFSISNGRKVLVTHEDSNIVISGEILQCLSPGEWLNDEVINLYLELLKEREKREPQKYLKCHFFNTFFYKKLSGKSGYDFKSVRRWTTQRKLGYFLFECDKIFVPIHKEVHWCLAVINKKDEKFQYLDSLGGVDKQVLKILARYFVDEVKDKNGKDVDVSSWKQEYVEDLPAQENGFDCGMFMIKYADFYSRDVGLCFNQEHMPYFRLRTAKEILRLKAE